MTGINLKALAKLIADETKKNESPLMTPRDIAFMLGYAPDASPVRRILADPTFPIAVSFVEKGTRRYLRKDVVAWIESKFNKARADVMYTHPNDPRFRRL